MGDPRRLLVVVSAPSGAGKTSLCQEVVRRVPGLAHSVSYTTRPSRAHEVAGRDYHFVDEATFQRMVTAGDFAEWASVHGHHYGTSRLLLETHFGAGQDVILDIDVQGAKQVRCNAQPVTVFIAPPSLAELERRLRGRGTESEESLRRRLNNAEKEMQAADAYTYLIVNDRLEQAVLELKSVIIAERCRQRA